MLAGPAIPCSALLRVGFAEPPRSPGTLVRSYRTVSPLPDPDDPGFPEPRRPSAVCSLWHFPAGRPDWPLASTLPCGAPTFLDTITSCRGHPASSPSIAIVARVHVNRPTRLRLRLRVRRRPRRWP